MWMAIILWPFVHKLHWNTDLMMALDKKPEGYQCHHDSSSEDHDCFLNTDKADAVTWWAQPAHVCENWLIQQNRLFRRDRHWNGVFRHVLVNIQKKSKKPKNKQKMGPLNDNLQCRKKINSRQICTCVCVGQMLTAKTALGCSLL